MNKSASIKIFMGIICFLLVVAGVVWFFVYKQYKSNQESQSKMAEVEIVTPTMAPVKPADEESEVTITAMPEGVPAEVSFSEGRLGDPALTKMVPTEVANELGITKENYPRIDSSTSTFSLVQSLYWKMFTFVDYDDYDARIGPPQAPAKTIPSYKGLIAGDVDLIIVPDPSQEVRELEKKSGVELEYIQIGVEGLVFITSKDNPVSNITIEQANQIYADMAITNWSQLGGKNGEILALCRNDDSGSQAQFDNLVMGEGKEINQKLVEKYTLDDMQTMVSTVSGETRLWRDGKEIQTGDNFPLGYSVYYYLQAFEDEEMVGNIKELSVNGVLPTAKTIDAKEYPLAMGYFAVIRKDTPQDAPERIIANWMTTMDGQEEVAYAGLGKIPN